MREAATVKDSWQRIDAWLSQNAPDVFESLQPGCSEEEIVAVEERLGFDLPIEVRESFKIHNGQEMYKTAGPLVGEPLDPLEYAEASCLSWRGLYDDQRKSDVDSGLSDYATSTPPDMVLCQYATPNWFPMGDWDGNCYGIDMNPGPNGIEGQVINFGRDEDNKFVLATSWAHFLEDIADEMEAGSFEIKRDDEGHIECFGRVGHDDQAMFNFWELWHQAKLPKELQELTPVDHEVELVGDVIDGELADQAIGIVASFIAEMHDYEMHWLAIRPIHELGYRRITESDSGYSAYPISGCSKVVRVEEMDLHKHNKKAARQKRLIWKKFATPRKRAMADAFVQRYPLDYDPQRDQVAEVRQVQGDYLIVIMKPVDESVARYHLLYIDGQWRIDLRDRSNEGGAFERISL
ncbi:SMI1/KNR4 family protein [Bremerella sp.]|uniref:SMI1/KNR4 family protein n=1 Tax=Bremerella sp. TaxID=2795602 RepID=UPI00391DC978